ncbi:ParB/RepB/Spo0J family partition protein [Actinotalea sp.]|uniref:ParB/RepB/Spo0J family partition protein n=1 Tax=Actinotalea sp. TaxID=1872145 RepID=UPI003563A410
MAEKRRGLGRGLGALIPNGSGAERPVDVFFPGTSAPVPVHATEGAAEGTDESTDESAAVSRETEAVPTGSATDARTPDTDVSRGTGTEPPAVGSPEPAPEPDVSRGTSTGQAPTELLPVPGAHFAELPVDAIIPNPRQPRTIFDEEALLELTNSIREIGVLQPVVVRRSGSDEAGAAQYELIMGERRWRATQEAGLAVIPAIVRETDDEDLLRDALLENLHRSQLNALEEAAAYQQLLDDFDCTHEELARRIHRSRPQISNTLRLLKLPPLVQRRVAAGVLSAGHARALLGLPDAGAMERLAQRIVAEGLSVRATEEIVTLGGDAPKPVVRRPRAGDRNAALDDLASRLSDRFDTRVKVQLGRTKGRLTVEFASVQDLNRILSTLSPEDPGLLR